MDQVPDQASPLWYPKLPSSFCQSFLDSVVVDTLMSLSHNKGGQGVISGQEYCVLDGEWSFYICESSSTTPNILVINEEIELLLLDFEVGLTHQMLLSTPDPQYLSMG